MKASTYADLTDYPRLYAPSYWGNFTAEDATGLDEVFANRNRFAEEYGLKKFQGFERPTGSVGFFDHCERYKNQDGNHVYIVSPYVGEPHQEYDDLALKFGLEPIYTLYHYNAASYIRIFSGKTDFNRYLKDPAKLN